MANVSRKDTHWFSQLSDRELDSYLQARVSLCVNPAQRDLCVDSRSFSGPLRIVHGIAVNQLHVLAVKSASPAASAGVFFRILPNEALHLTVDRDSESVQLHITDRICSPLGTRGVTALSLLAENQWEAITSYITEQSLRAAGLSFGTTVYGSENASENDCSPQFVSLPRLMPSEFMSVTEITNFHIDRSAYMAALAKSRYGSDLNRLLGELQLAFVCFHIFGCLRSLEHWTCLLREICNSANLNAVFAGFYEKAAIALEAQFRFFEEEEIRTAVFNELRQAFACFVCAGRNIKEVQKFAKTMNQVMGWSLTGELDDGDDSDGPVVVHVD
ncbi:unnamed protein product [Agarophyton chilense]